MNDFLKHIADWRDKSDERCIQLATNECGVDAEQALMNILERDFCISLCNNIVEEIRKL
jgi:hypothetical protein